jgi:hypothetical protein
MRLPVARSTVLSTLLLAAVTVSACSEKLIPPVDPEFGRWSEIAAGGYFTCGLTPVDVRHCWGFYSADPADGVPFDVATVPVPAPGDRALGSLTVGHGIACGLDEAGEALCWGPDLAPAAREEPDRRVPLPLAGDLRFGSISAGYVRGCAVTLSGEAYCWGPDLVPERVPGAGDLRFSSISVGTTQACAVATDQRLYCWGGGSGSVGVPHLDPATCSPQSACWTDTPQLVAGELRFSMVSAGNGFTCAVTVDGEGYCWGGLFDASRRFGVLGSGSTDGSAVPVPVAGGLRFTAIEAGTRAACGLSTGSAYCWGENTMGELGIGVYDDDPHPSPEPVRGDLHFKALSLGDVSCGVTTTNVAYCWGSAYGGLLGNGESDWSARPLPTRVLDPAPGG